MPTGCGLRAGRPAPGPVAARRGRRRPASGHRLVDRCGEVRVFHVAGDATHIHPPTRARGMNTGIRDACNLARKPALTVVGRAAPGP
ncbi:hypothetical protein AV521_02220 [Streptomyces sp. IMTB 2501]|nr:hypothetical protein AV521_02220 [Streptomyces sp. IMTB 2501]